MLPVFQLGPLAIATPGLALLAGVWVGLDLLSREAGRIGLNAERAYNAGFYALLAGLAGARLTFVATRWTAFRADPVSIVWPPLGSATPSGGMVAAALVGYWYLRRHSTPWARFLDALAPALAALAAFVSLANLLSGHAYGLPTTLPWAIELWSARRHPTQIYELIAALGVLVVLWRRRGRWPYNGAGFLTFVILFGLARLFLEAFRADSWVIVGGVRGAQVLALAAVIGALLLVARRAPVHAEPRGDERTAGV